MAILSAFSGEDAGNKKAEPHFAKIDADLLMEFRVFLASTKGFEPPACRLGGGRSIQLSYVDVFNFFGLFTGFFDPWEPPRVVRAARFHLFVFIRISCENGFYHFPHFAGLLKLHFSHYRRCSDSSFVL